MTNKNQTRILSEEEYLLEAEPIYQKVILGSDLIGYCSKPFSPNITERAIVYPCYNYPDSWLLDALIAGAYNVQDTGCYFNTLYSEKNEYCYIPLTQLKPPWPIDSYTWYAIYSSEGKWGLVGDIEKYGILGGVPEFMKVVREMIPDLNEQVYGFLDKMGYFERVDEAEKSSSYPKNDPLLEWIPKLLVHVYGEEAANKILQKN